MDWPRFTHMHQKSFKHDHMSSMNNLSKNFMNQIMFRGVYLPSLHSISLCGPHRFLGNNKKQPLPVVAAKSDASMTLYKIEFCLHKGISRCLLSRLYQIFAYPEISCLNGLFFLVLTTNLQLG